MPTTTYCIHESRGARHVCISTVSVRVQSVRDLSTDSANEFERDIGTVEPVVQKIHAPEYIYILCCEYEG